MNLKDNSFSMSVIFRQVHEGQELTVVEAMKMQNSLHAGLSGTVSKLWKDDGDIISNLSSIFILSSDPGPQGDPLPPRGELSLERKDFSHFFQHGLVHG